MWSSPINLQQIIDHEHDFFTEESLILLTKDIIKARDILQNSAHSNRKLYDAFFDECLESHLKIYTVAKRVNRSTPKFFHFLIARALAYAVIRHFHELINPFMLICQL